jgi:hypothetical protein
MTSTPILDDNGEVQTPTARISWQRTADGYELSIRDLPAADASADAKLGSGVRLEMPSGAHVAVMFQPGPQ